MPTRKPAVTYADKPWLASYPPDVPADYDFPDVPLTRLLDDAAASFPTTTALAFLGTRITYRELKDQVDRFATALAGLGVGKGDRVAIVLPNCPQNVVAFFAALRIGAVVVEHNPLYTEAELAHQLADCGADVVVCLDKVYDTVAAVRAKTSVREIVVASVVEYLPSKQRLLLQLPLAKARRTKADISAPVPKAPGVRRFLSLLHAAKTPARQVALDPRTDLALLQYTGGTTGLSKGAMLTHRNLVANAYQNRLWLPDVQAGREVTLAVLPLFHAYGLTVCMNLTVLLGGTLVLIPRFDLGAVFKAIDEFKPTLFPGVPPIYKAIVDSPEVRRHDLKSIKACVSGAMKLPVETQEQFEKVSGGRLVEGYGMTETSPSTHGNPVFGKRKAGTIGMPLPGTECRVVSQDDMSVEVPVGEPGELAIRGPQVFAGYWNRDDETKAAFTPDGFVLTGDIARMDDEGYFEIVDRKKELIIAGGFNIYPSEVEAVLRALPRRDGEGVRRAGARLCADRGGRRRALRGVAGGVQGAEARGVPRLAADDGRGQGAAPGAAGGGAREGGRRGRAGQARAQGRAAQGRREEGRRSGHEAGGRQEARREEGGSPQAGEGVAHGARARRRQLRLVRVQPGPVPRPARRGVRGEAQRRGAAGPARGPRR
jgi:long-chain acyl-CoA synthetase